MYDDELFTPEDDVNSENKAKPDKKERRYIIIFCVAAALYIIACAAVFVILDSAERAAYVKVTPIARSGDEIIIPGSEKININTATAEELMTLNGIGEVTAAKIIEYREAYGGFLYIDELLNINGIGEKSLDRIRPYITL